MRIAACLAWSREALGGGEVQAATHAGARVEAAERGAGDGGGGEEGGDGPNMSVMDGYSWQPLRHGVHSSIAATAAAEGR